MITYQNEELGNHSSGLRFFSTGAHIWPRIYMRTIIDPWFISSGSFFTSNKGTLGSRATFRTLQLKASQLHQKNNTYRGWWGGWDGCEDGCKDWSGEREGKEMRRRGWVVLVSTLFFLLLPLAKHYCFMFFGIVNFIYASSNVWMGIVWRSKWNHGE